MLAQIDLSRKIDKTEYKTVMEELSRRLAALQREAIQLKIPIVVVFEGWDAAGKGTLINQLILTLDPRHFSVFSTLQPGEEEIHRPFLWRFWIKTPAKGRMTIFDRSWYHRVLLNRVEKRKTLKNFDWDTAHHEINSFERQLTDDGNVIVKFFLHISKKTQRDRFAKLEKTASMSWRVSKGDWSRHKKYDKYLLALEELLAKTDTDYAPWTIVESHDRRFATVKIFKAVIKTLEERIAGVKAQASQKQNGAKVVSNGDNDGMTVSILNRVDLSPALEKADYLKKVKKYQERIRDLEHEVYVKRIPVVIVYEGWDAAGKGGNIKRLTQHMDPRGYEVIPIAAPNDIEKRHHYLWRFWQEMPKAGHIAIFDRSWYGRVLVERVEGFCTPEEYKRAYREINEMEEHLANYGTVLVKFWLQIDKEEQLRRFTERKNSPFKSWKLTDEDWRNREKWDIYQDAVEEMLFRTSSPHARWTIVESNSKYYARLKALKTVIGAIEAKL